MAQLSNTIINGKLKVNGTIEGSLSGNATSANSATTASKLSTSSGNSTLPVYFSNGVPVSCSTTLGVSITGNANSATSLQTSAGSKTMPVYFSGGKPVQCSGTLGLTSADSNKLGGKAAADYKAAFSTVSTSGSTLTFTRIDGTTQEATISVSVSGTSVSANSVKIENKSNSSTTGYLVGVSTTGETYQSLYATSKISFNTSTGLFTAKTFSGAFSGNATSATSLQTSAGSKTMPVYFSGGKPVQCSGTLGLNATSASKLTTSSAGSASMPVYFSNGVPAAITSLSFPDSERHGSIYINKLGISISTSEASEDERNCWIQYDNGSFKIGGFNLIQATTFSGAFSGNATSATNATNATKVNITNIDTSNTNYGILVQSASGNQSPIKSGVTINPHLKTISAPSGYKFSGAFSGNATTATALTSNAGSSTTPVYFSNGKPVACGHAFTSYLPLAGGTLTGTLNTKKIVVQGANASLNIENITASIDYAKIETPTDRALHLQAPSDTYLVVGDTTYSTDRTNKYKFIVNGISKFNPPANVANTEQATAIIGTANGGQVIIGKEGANSGTMLRFDQSAGTPRLRFRASETAGAIVWEQPETNSTLYYDVKNIQFREVSGIQLQNFKNGILKTDSAGNLSVTSTVPVASKVNISAIGTTNADYGILVHNSTGNQSPIKSEITINPSTKMIKVPHGYRIQADTFMGQANSAETATLAYAIKTSSGASDNTNYGFIIGDQEGDTNPWFSDITLNPSTKVINLNGYTIPGLGGGSSSSSTSEVQYGHSKITSNFMLNPYVYFYIYSEQTGENYEVYLSSDQMGYCTRFKMIAGVPHFQLGPCSNGVLTAVEQDVICEKVGTKMYRFFPTIENQMSQYAGFPVAPISTNSVYFVNVSTTPYTVNNSKSVVFYKDTNINPNYLPNQTITYELFNTGLYVFSLKPSSATDEFNINIEFAPLKCEDKYLGRPIFFTDGDQNKFANSIHCDIDTVSNSSDSTTPVLTNILLIHQKGNMSYKSFAIEVTDAAAYVGFLNEV